jgi:integrase
MPTLRINFTKKDLEALGPAPVGQITYVFDTNRASPRGFGLWITPGSAKTFMLYRKINGRPERMKIGPLADWSIDRARDEAQKLITRINEGKNPQSEKRKLRGQPTLGQLFAKYLEDHAKLHARSWKELEADFERYLATIENRRLVEIEKSDVARLHAALGREKGRYTANRAIELLRAIVNWGLKNHVIDPQMLAREENPAAGIRAFDEVKRDRFVQAHELPRFFRALADESSPYMHDFVLLSLLTGARRSNVLSMRWADLSLDQATWRIPDTKNKEPLNLPLMPDAVAVLRRRLEGQKDKDGNATSEYVFPGPGAKGHMVSPKKGWRRVLDRARLYDLVELVGKRKGWSPDRMEEARKEARKTERKALGEYRATAEKLDIDGKAVGLPDLRLHDLRRTIGSWQAATGASLHIIGKSLGHKDAKSTQIYARLDLDPVRQAMQAATEAIMIAGGLKTAARKQSRTRRLGQR